MNILEKVNRKIACSVIKKKGLLELSEPVVTFSFDDFPLSSYSVAGKILEEHGMRGVYYLAPRLIGTRQLGFEQCTEQAIRDLVAAGHELAGHTYSHQSCIGLSKKQLKDELRAADLHCAKHYGVETKHFAYPLGEYGPRSKRLIMGHYETARSIRGGLNRGQLDLANLRANAIYSSNYSTKRFRALLDEAISNSGWLIFYTHEVEDGAGKYGCLPGEFRSVVELVSEMGVAVKTISGVLDINPAF